MTELLDLSHKAKEAPMPSSGSTLLLANAPATYAVCVAQGKFIDLQIMPSRACGAVCKAHLEVGSGRGNLDLGQPHIPIILTVYAVGHANTVMRRSKAGDVISCPKDLRFPMSMVYFSAAGAIDGQWENGWVVRHASNLTAPVTGRWKYNKSAQRQEDIERSAAALEDEAGKELW